jgi:drug/metabolite transporter (DMT)-like permease
VVTVLLARRVLHEHLTPTQFAGLALALGGVVLLAVG